MGRPKGSRNKKQTLRQEMQRQSWDQLGVSKVRYEELRDNCKAGVYDEETLLRACTGFEFIKSWILCSVKGGVSFDRLELHGWEDRPPIGRTDFYGYRRLFYRNLNEIVLKENEESVYEKAQVHNG